MSSGGSRPALPRALGAGDRSSTSCVLGRVLRVDSNVLLGEVGCPHTVFAAARARGRPRWCTRHRPSPHGSARAAPRARSMPRSTSGSPPIAMATRSAATRAADLPSAIMIRPQLGLAPWMAVFTSGELATLARGDQRVLARPGAAHRNLDDLGRALPVRDEHAGEAHHHRLKARERTGAVPCPRARAWRSRPGHWRAPPPCRSSTDRRRR